MTKKEYFEFAEEFFKNCLFISRAKNQDYAGAGDDPFLNFKSVEVLGIRTEVGFLTRMMDKMKRISSFVEQGTLQVKDESVTDTLQDLANYSALLAAYIKSKDKGVYLNPLHEYNRTGLIKDTFKQGLNLEEKPGITIDLTGK
jgi:Nucleotide modification associated domain 1